MVKGRHVATITVSIISQFGTLLPRLEALMYGSGTRQHTHATPSALHGCECQCMIVGAPPGQLECVRFWSHTVLACGTAAAEAGSPIGVLVCSHAQVHRVRLYAVRASACTRATCEVAPPSVFWRLTQAFQNDAKRSSAAHRGYMWRMACHGNHCAG